MNKNLHNMNLHEVVELNPRMGHSVMRVPGGWIYKFTDIRVFVPFSNEFQEESPELLKEKDAHD
jgi:hypothetical protein